MKYRHFEILVAVVVAATVLASIAFLNPSTTVSEESFAQVMLVLVLVAALHWGRNGGIIAAALASLTYLALRTPMLLESLGSEEDILSILGVRVLTYLVVGAIGGELFARIKYLFARLENSCSIDELSGVYNQQFITRTLEAALGQHVRYGAPFSIVFLSISAEAQADLKPKQRNKLIRETAHYLRNDLRMVDEVGRLDDERFLLVLPNTPGAGASVVATRTTERLDAIIRVGPEALQTETLSAPEDLDRITGTYRELLGSRELPPGATQAPEAAAE